MRGFLFFEGVFPVVCYKWVLGEKKKENALICNVADFPGVNPSSVAYFKLAMGCH